MLYIFVKQKQSVFLWELLCVLWRALQYGVRGACGVGAGEIVMEEVERMGLGVIDLHKGFASSWQVA